MNGERAVRGNRLIVAVDPGREKCGYAVVEVGRDPRRAPAGPPGQAADVVDRGIVGASTAAAQVANIAIQRGARIVAVGDRTGSRNFRRVLTEELAARSRERGIAPPEVVSVDEHLSSQEGRAAYLKDHPGKGIWRLLPASLRWPDRPYDDYVAVVLARRCASGLSWQKRDRQEEEE